MGPTGVQGPAVRRNSADYASRARLVAASRDLGDILRHSEPAHALAVYDYGLQRSAEIENTESLQDRARLLADSSYPLLALHRREEAKRRIDAAFNLLGYLKLWPAQTIRPGDQATYALRALGDYYADKSQATDAARTYRELLDKTMASKPSPETDLRDANSISVIERRLAELERKAGQTEEADSLDRSRRELWQRWDQRRPNNSFVRRQLTAVGLK